MQFAVAAKLTLEVQRSLFLRMEKSIKKTGKTQFYSQLEQLDDYSLVPYLEYQWLKNNLDQAVKIKGFLKNREKTRYASLLKYKWQFYLAEHQQWSEFVSHYKHTNNTKLRKGVPASGHIYGMPIWTTPKARVFDSRKST